MKKYKKTLHIHDFQQKLDDKYGKGKFHAVLVLSLFFCLSFTSCSNDLHNSGTTNRSNIGGSIEGTTHEGQSSGARIQITNTGQTVTLNKPPYGDNPTVLDAYFARQDTKSNEYKKINSAIIGDVVYIVVDTANLFAKKITVTIKDKNNIISGNIPFQQYKSNGNEFADKCEDVKGKFVAKVRNEKNDQRFALYKIALKGKDEVTTKKWKEAIEKHSEKKLQLCLTVQADEKNVIYCGSNDDKDNEKNVWLNQVGRWFTVRGILTWHDPVDYPRLTKYNWDGNIKPSSATYGNCRIHNGNKKYHAGVDFFAIPGEDKVYACLKGNIHQVRYSAKAGWIVRVKIQNVKDLLEQEKNVNYKTQYNDELKGIDIKETDDVYFIYMHLQSVIFTEEDGINKTEVNAGTELGYAGVSGSIANKGHAPHLHLEVATVLDAYGKGESVRTNPARFVRLNSYDTKDQDDENKPHYHKS